MEDTWNQQKNGTSTNIPNIATAHRDIDEHSDIDEHKDIDEHGDIDEYAETVEKYDTLECESEEIGNANLTNHKLKDTILAFSISNSE